MKTYKIFSDSIDEKTKDQFFKAMEADGVVRGALMPDAHLGYSLPIGGVVATRKIIYPAWIGFDIGCGMCAIKLQRISSDEIRAHSTDIYDKILRTIPMGFNHHKSSYKQMDTYRLTKTGRAIYEEKIGDRQIGTLGGGNHFIEIGESQNDQSVWIVIHSGSRGVGWNIADHYMKLAAKIKHTDQCGFFEKSIEGQCYISDMNYMLDWALENRRTMLKDIVWAISSVVGFVPGPDWDNMINRNHNHATYKDGMWIHRKGATHAEKGMRGVIPGNMRDGSFIVEGLGNSDSLWSSSHGAGRVLSRTQAKKKIKMKDFEIAMEGIVANVSPGTKDESPFAYKAIFNVMEDQKDLVKVVDYVKPIINIKG